MKKILRCLFIIPILHSSVQAADKIRIGFSELIASYSSLPLAQKKGFLQEEGTASRIYQDEYHRWR